MKQLSIYDDLDRYQSYPFTSHAEAKPKPARQANVTEIIIAQDKADNVQMILPMLTRLNQEQRWLAWIDPPIAMLKEWNKSREEGVMDEIMVLRSNAKQSALELSEKALQAGTCHAVIVWTEGLSNEDFAKLEQASIEGDSHGIVLRYR